MYCWLEEQEPHGLRSRPGRRNIAGWRSRSRTGAGAGQYGGAALAEMARSACREEGGGDGGETLRRRRLAERARSVCGKEGGGDGAAAATGREGEERVRGRGTRRWRRGSGGGGSSGARESGTVDCSRGYCWERVSETEDLYDDV